MHLSCWFKALEAVWLQKAVLFPWWLYIHYACPFADIFVCHCKVLLPDMIRMPWNSPYPASHKPLTSNYPQFPLPYSLVFFFCCLRFDHCSPFARLFHCTLDWWSMRKDMHLMHYTFGQCWWIVLHQYQHDPFSSIDYIFFKVRNEQKCTWCEKLTNLLDNTISIHWIRLTFLQNFPMAQNVSTRWKLLKHDWK